MNAKRVGYLRMAPSYGSDPMIAPTAAVKSMWRKLTDNGAMVAADAKKTLFTRSMAGERELDQHDRTLSEPCRAVLNVVQAGESKVAVMKGMITVLNAGLVEFCEDSCCYILTDAGKCVADPIGEDGYFTKSGNLVHVHGVSVDPSGEAMLQVVRLEGESKGKGMLIPRDAFVSKDEWGTHVEG